MGSSIYERLDGIYCSFKGVIFVILGEWEIVQYLLDQKEIKKTSMTLNTYGWYIQLAVCHRKLSGEMDIHACKYQVTKKRFVLILFEQKQVC